MLWNRRDIAVICFKTKARCYVVYVVDWDRVNPETPLFVVSYQE